MKRILYVAEINPVPWKAPQSVPRKTATGKHYGGLVQDAGLRTYKTSLRELVAAGYPDLAAPLPGTPLQVTFLFWRQLEQYRGPKGRLVTTNAADATNLQKSTEDALEGILFHNDRANVSVRSDIVEQELTTNPGVVIIVDDQIVTPDWQAYRAGLDQLEKPWDPGNVLYYEVEK